MDIVVVSLVALVASALTLFSGFGLGTLLMPVVAIFFSVEVAIGITAIVHLANNLFKGVLVGRQANRGVVFRFGLPAVLCAFLGAALLGLLVAVPELFRYSLLGYELAVTPLNLIVGVLILIFVGIDLSPRIAKMSMDQKYMPLGGALSGFFGGLSGHQGAFRSIFLIKSGLSKEQFVATGVMIAVLVDLSRLAVYGWEIRSLNLSLNWALILSACFAAFLGAYVGAKLVKKVTLRAIQLLVSIMLVVVALGLIAGVV